MMIMMKSVVFVAIAIVISGVFVATVDAVVGKFHLFLCIAHFIINGQIEFSRFVRIKFCVHGWFSKAFKGNDRQMTT